MFGEGEAYDDDNAGMDREFRVNMTGFYSDDEDDDVEPGEFSFEGTGFDRLEVYEKERTENMLLETEFRLYHEPLDYEEVLHESRHKKVNPEQERMRYYSEGYNANVDEIDDLEISRWQSRFPYFHVVGTGEDPRNDEHVNSGADNIGGDEDEHIDRAPASQLDFQSLVIEGRAATIHFGSAVPANEIMEEEGVWEEVIAIHSDPTDDSLPVPQFGDGIPPTEPKESMRYEIEASFVQSLWPSAVQALRPLVGELVRQHVERAESK